MENLDKIAWLITHAAAFLLLVWLMRKTAWHPILRFLDERRESIERQFKEVERLKDETRKTQEEYQAQLRAAQAEARELVTKAKADAHTMAENLRAETQAALDKSRKEASDRIAQETELARIELRRYAAGLAVSVAEKFLTENLTDQQRHDLTEKALPEVERAVSRN